MQILVVIAIVFSGSSLILARPHIPWPDYGSEELFAGYTDADYENTYTDDLLRSELKALAMGVDHHIYATEDPVNLDDTSLFEANTAINDNNYDDTFSNLLRVLKKTLKDEYERQTETTVDSNENSERDSNEDSSKADVEGSGEYSNGDSRVIFSAHIGFNKDNLFKINLLNSDDDENLKPDEYNRYDTSAASSSATQDPMDISNEPKADTETITNKEMSVLLKSSSAPLILPQNVEILSKLSLSSSNSELLTSEFQDNVQDFEKSHKHLEDALNTLNYQSKIVSDKFLTTAAGRTDYNGLQHKDIEMELSEMLANVDKVRAKISEMQLMEQRLNYHMLLNALLKEVYGQGGAL